MRRAHMERATETEAERKSVSARTHSSDRIFFFLFLEFMVNDDETDIFKYNVC